MAGDIGTIQLQHKEIIKEGGTIARQRSARLTVRVQRSGDTWKLVSASEEPQTDVGTGASDPTTQPAQDATTWPAMQAAIESAQRAAQLGASTRSER